MSWEKGKPMAPKTERTTEIGQRITDLRLELKLTQRDVCNLCDINRVTIWAFETGKCLPNMHHAIALAEALQTTPVYLFTGQGSRWNLKSMVDLPWKTGRDPRGPIYCSYCNKGAAWTIRQLEYNGLPLPNFCGWCGKKVRSD